ncbi:SrpA-related protein [Campylobacter sputorum subsp. bubulus]|uniref:SrpA-related protein n=1 Tax=Campylobacter sputorum subsp. sputorum TaxID=32024 RepID=A0A381DIX6_9BACT|nr:putative metalloprotease CJM1_0395 family protein [Campylobacter sputorum]ASM35472.1 SprA-related family protein [Campylobacter sputorum aubsp. sputorum RM3237]QEL05664.1 SprA family protein [Campylobacter sputorum subsp. sputorum]SUX08384.1 SrpA-related protein [Campylobacter sputorum subsp. bubulus]SUX10431.1 SrpA-related protein [Campylobacter sputorum subsp. sputorum]
MQIYTSFTPNNPYENNYNKNKNELSQEEKLQVAKLQKRDSEVKAHEAAHLASGAGLIRGLNYSYEKGPDGKQYAVGGEVMLDTSKGKTPQETIQKSEQIKRAALAPSNPSSADLKIAANAEAMKNNAQSELRKELIDTKVKFSSKNPLKIYNDTEIPNILGLF